MFYYGVMAQKHLSNIGGRTLLEDQRAWKLAPIKIHYKNYFINKFIRFWARNLFLVVFCAVQIINYQMMEIKSE